MGVNVQVCWDKFSAATGDGRAEAGPMDGERYHLTADEAGKYCDENTIGVVADPRVDLRRQLRARRGDLRRARQARRRRRPGRSRARGRCLRGFIAPFVQPDLVWDFQLPRVQSINVSRAQVRARLPRRGVGDLARRGSAAEGPRVRGQLPRGQDADLRAELLAPGQRGRGAVLHVRQPGAGGLSASSRASPVRWPSTIASEIAAMGPYG